MYKHSKKKTIAQNVPSKNNIHFQFGIQSVNTKIHRNAKAEKQKNIACV